MAEDGLLRMKETMIRTVRAAWFSSRTCPLVSPHKSKACADFPPSPMSHNSWIHAELGPRSAGSFSLPVLAPMTNLALQVPFFPSRGQTRYTRYVFLPKGLFAAAYVSLRRGNFGCSTVGIPVSMGVTYQNSAGRMIPSQLARNRETEEE